MALSVVQMLKHCQLFEGLNENELAGLSAIHDSRTLTYGRREVYSVAGNDCRHVDVVLKGELSVHMVGVTGRTVEVLRLRPGDLVAPCYIFASDARQSFSIEADTDVTVLRFSKYTIQHLIDTYREIRCNFIRILSDISCYLAARIYFLSLLTVKEKVMYYLRTEARKQQSRVVMLDCSRQRMAETFGIQKFSLLRCLAELSEQGVIRVDGRNIVILKSDALRG